MPELKVFMWKSVNFMLKRNFNFIYNCTRSFTLFSSQISKSWSLTESIKMLLASINRICCLNKGGLSINLIHIQKVWSRRSLGLYQWIEDVGTPGQCHYNSRHLFSQKVVTHYFHIWQPLWKGLGWKTSSPLLHWPDLGPMPTIRPITEKGNRSMRDHSYFVPWVHCH